MLETGEVKLAGPGARQPPTRAASSEAYLGLGSKLSARLVGSAWMARRHVAIRHCRS